jgi:hypothetical protein
MEKQHPPKEYPPEEPPSAPDPSQENPEGVSSAAAVAAPVTKPLPEALSANHAPTPVVPSRPLEVTDRSPGSRPSTQQLWHNLPRRQVLIGAGIVVGVAALGTGTTLALISGSPSGGSAPSPASSGPSATGTTGTVGLPPVQTPVSEDTLQAWRTKRLTVQPSQRFQHQRGTVAVPLGVVEPTYPNPYNPYHIHLQGYVLGGVLVARTQCFLYLGLESLDGSQFVAKVRVGPVNQTSKTFGLLVVQQSTDAIEGGPAEFPQVTLAPRAIYQTLPALVNHCIEVVFIRQPLPADQDEIPANMLPEVNKQATISDQFLQVDYEAIHRTPLAQISFNELEPIRHLIDDSAIIFHSAIDARHYPLATQFILRHADQLYPKLVASQ